MKADALRSAEESPRLRTRRCVRVVGAVFVHVVDMSTVEGEGDLSRTVFFLDFFTFLILSDIIILLVSYKHITDFPQLARNTGFVLSTVSFTWVSEHRASPVRRSSLSALLAAGVLRLSLLGSRFGNLIQKALSARLNRPRASS